MYLLLLSRKSYCYLVKFENIDFYAKMLSIILVNAISETSKKNCVRVDNILFNYFEKLYRWTTLYRFLFQLYGFAIVEFKLYYKVLKEFF